MIFPKSLLAGKFTTKCLFYRNWPALIIFKVHGKLKHDISPIIYMKLYQSKDLKLLFLEGEGVLFSVFWVETILISGELKLCFFLFQTGSVIH